jgi:AcrR family transcriptional regulator
MNEPDQSQPISRRERLKREREDRILDAAAAVFARKGFHRATIREVAQLADVADGTIYNYFANKADLLIGIMARLAELDQLPDELTRALQSDFRDFLIAILHQRMGRFQQGQEMIQAILPEVLVNPALRERYYRQFVQRIVTLMEPYLQMRIELGHIRPVNVPLTVRIVQGMFIGLLLLRILGDEMLQSAWDDLPEALAALLFNGLNPEGGG